MSYTKREWATGNVVGAVDLNRMEQGIEDAGSIGSGDMLVVTTSSGGTGTVTMDKTWQEIYDAFPNVIVAYSNEFYANKSLILSVVRDEEDYEVILTDVTFTTDSSSGYPQYNNIV